jgi:hypothetical protein
MGVKGKTQEWCRLVWMRVEMWERGGWFESLIVDSRRICYTAKRL